MLHSKCVKLCLSMVLFLTGQWVLARPLLRCQFEVNAQTYQHDFKPVADPYTVESVDLGVPRQTCFL